MFRVILHATIFFEQKKASTHVLAKGLQPDDGNKLIT